MGGAWKPLPHTRVWNIAVRTIHIGLIGALFGGHIFGIPAERLLAWLYPTIVSGAALIFIEAHPRWRWFHEGRGVMVSAKLLLLCSIPWLWSYRVPILAVVIIIGSVGSHMPRQLRYYSLLRRRVLGEP